MPPLPLKCRYLANNHNVYQNIHLWLHNFFERFTVYIQHIHICYLNNYENIKENKPNKLIKFLGHL